MKPDKYVINSNDRKVVLYVKNLSVKDSLIKNLQKIAAHPVIQEKQLHDKLSDALNILQNDEFSLEFKSDNNVKILSDISSKFENDLARIGNIIIDIDSNLKEQNNDKLIKLIINNVYDNLSELDKSLKEAFKEAEAYINLSLETSQAIKIQTQIEENINAPSLKNLANEKDSLSK